MKKTIEHFLNFKLQIDDNDKKTLETILAVMNDETPEKVSINEMILTYKLDNKTLLKNVFDAWLNTGFTVTDFTSFLEQTKYLEGNTPFIEYIVVALWNTKTPTIKDIREDLIKIILNKAKWDRISYNNFIKNNDNHDLVAFISKSSGIIGKIFGFFKK